MDNIGHMTKDSMPIMGSKLKLQQLSKNVIGYNLKFWWHGKMMGLTMNCTVEVTKWIKEAVAKIIIELLELLKLKYSNHAKRIVGCSMFVVSNHFYRAS